MRRIVALGVAVLAASALLAAPAQAQPHYGFGPGYGFMSGNGYGPGMMQPGRGRFTMIDTNDDGNISAEEAASAADEVFTAMDNDDDGLLTQEEYMSVRMGPQQGFNPARQAAMQEAKSARYGTMDANKDGSVSKEEFLGAAQSHYGSADGDADGKVSPWEYRRQNWN